MRLNTAIVVSSLVLLGGLFSGQPHIWIPATTLGASTIDLFTREWVISSQLGSRRMASAILKSILALVGLYAIIGQFASIGLVIWWFIGT